MKHIDAPVDDLRERFILFLAGKNPAQEYAWQDQRVCPCGQFIQDNLTTMIDRRFLGFLQVRPVRTVDSAQARQVWIRWNHTAKQYPRTYGALLERVRGSV